MARNNPQNIITPDAFAVAPDLLGIGLARPSRRLLAIAIDGVLLAILANVGGKMLFTFATALLLWRTAAVFTGGRQSLVKTLLRIASVVLITIFLTLAYGRVSDRFLDKGDGADAGTDAGAAVDVDAADDADPPGDAGPPAVPGDSPTSDSVPDTPAGADRGAGRGDERGLAVTTASGENIDFSSLGLTFRDSRILLLFGQIESATDSAAAAPLADSLGKWIASRPAETRPQLASAFVTALDEAPGHAAVVASLTPFLPADTFPPGDTVGRRLAAASAQVARLERENRRLKEDAEEAEEGLTVKKLLRNVSDVAGFGLGWSALYFTGFLLLMRGQTPGKKLLGIRVIRLDGRPLSTWICFERFGGYAASTATGLLGFAQILWDRNRQALHDKATETVVIREVNGMPVRPDLPVRPDQPSA